MDWFLIIFTSQWSAESRECLFLSETAAVGMVLGQATSADSLGCFNSGKSPPDGRPAGSGSRGRCCIVLMSNKIPGWQHFCPFFIFFSLQQNELIWRIISYQFLWKSYNLIFRFFYIPCIVFFCHKSVQKCSLSASLKLQRMNYSGHFKHHFNVSIFYSTKSAFCRRTFSEPLWIG